MNKTYRSIWNPSLGCYVAAPECAVAHAAGTSSQRVARATPLMRSKSVLALESRVLFDGAMLATAIEQDSAPPAPEIPDVQIDEPVEAAAEAPAPAPVPASDGAAVAAASETVVATDTAEESDATTPQAVEPAANASQEIVFVDGRVTDPAAFQSEGREVIVLALDQDGMSQIASALAGRTDIDAIHIVSHGSDGLLTLGSTEVTAASIQSTQLAYLQSIGQALSAEGDILIYACDYASGASGLEAMNLLADITGADVAASTDATGHESLGADWTLEQTTGEVDAQALAPLEWMNALDFTFTGAGTVGAVGMANNIMGAGVTVVSATYQGGATQSGTFASGSGVTFGSNVLGFTSGTLLSTGSNAAGVAGPNNNGGFGSDAAGVDGDAALNAMAGNPTFDAAILNISFIPDVPPGGSTGDVGRMTLEIVFGSEEYVEYVGQMNDVMEVTVNGTVVSLVPNSSGGESTIGINSVNTTQNPSLFINNTGATYNTQMDAFTDTIPMVFDVILGQTNTIRLAVADAVDTAYDSWMFVRADSGQTVVVAEDDEVTTAANLPITVDLTANDYSLSGGSMSLTHIQGQAVTQGQVITLGSGIQLTVGSGGQVTVTGNGSSAANDTFTYQVSNGMGGVASATVNVAITAPNLNPPVAQNDVEAVLADATLSDSVLTNNGNGADTDPNGNPLSVVQVNLTGFTAGTPFALPSGALLTMNANGTYVYDTNGAFAGLAGGATTTDSFSYTVSDGQGGNDTATVSITVTGVASNHAPVAVDDSYVVNEDDAVSPGLLTLNDSDVDGNMAGVDYYRGGALDPADYPVISSGQLLVNWTSNADDGTAGGVDGRHVADAVVQNVSSLTAGNGVTITGNATRQAIDVSGLNSASLAEARSNGDYIEASFTTLTSIIDISSVAFGVLDSNGLGGGYTVTIELLPEGDPAQALSLTASHALPGSPAPGGYSWDQVNVDASHLLSPQTSYTVRIYIYGNPSDNTAEINDFHLFYNDRGVQDTNVLAAGDQGGFFGFDDSGGLIFNPNGDFDDLREGESRDTHWVYTLFDAEGASDTATVTITVQGVNDAPMGVDDAFDADEDGGYSLGAPVANDVDPDSSWLYMGLNGLTGTNGGSFSADDSGNLIFIAGTDFDDLNVGETRQTSYTYTVNDGEGAQAAATVTVTVHGANDAPVGGDDAFTVFEDGEVSLGILTDNDVDADSDAIFVDTSAVIAGDNGGFFSFDDSGNLSFNPDGDFNHLGEGESASTRFYYTLFDDQGASSMATVTVNVLGVNDAPVAEDDNFAGFEDSALSLGSVLANDSDVEGDELTMATADVAGSGGGRFVVDGSMNLTFDPNGEFEDLQVGETRETSFTYAISDGNGGSAQAVVTVTVTGANDAPVAQDDHFDADNQAAITLGSPLLNDSDVDGDELSQGQVLVGEGSNGGTFGVDDSGNLSFDPAGAFADLAVGDTRDTSFSYTITDGNGGLSSATVTVTVHGAESVEMQQIAMVEAPSYPNEVVFVDARIPDPQAFAIAGRELVVLTLDEDGLAQMAAVLAGRSGVEAIHIVSHGGDGYLTLGSGNVDANSFQSSQLPSLDALAQALSANGDILIYACDFASGAEGQNTLQLLAQYTLADVAASLGTTGHDTLSGNWTLEMTVGSVEAVALAPEGWVHTLNLGSAPLVQDATEVLAPTPAVQSPAAEAATAAAAAVTAPVSEGAVVRQDGSLPGFEALGATRVVSLEDVFRQTLTPFMTGGTDSPSLADSGAGLQWTIASMDTGTDTVAATAPLAGWLPTLESLDDSLVDEAAVNADPLEPQSADVDALQVARQQAAPGFAAQLARWSQWTTQRPLTRAVARA